MRKLSDDAGAPKTLRALRFLAIRLRGRPEAEEVRGLVEGARTQLRAAYEQWLQAREERVAASQQLRYEDERLDEAMADLARRALVLVGGDRTDARYRRLFRQPPSEAMAPRASEAQAAFVRGVLQAIEEEEAFAELREAASRLGERLAAVEAALAARRERADAEVQARGRLEQALEEGRRAYNLAHPRLTLLFPDAPRLVESFFLPAPEQLAAMEEAEA